MADRTALTVHDILAGRRPATNGHRAAPELVRSAAAERHR
jgi:hypothetical protein